jgi:hypothetical protein
VNQGDLAIGFRRNSVEGERCDERGQFGICQREAQTGARESEVFEVNNRQVANPRGSRV